MSAQQYDRDHLIMFRFFSKLPSFLQAAKKFAASAIRALNVVIQVCEFTSNLLTPPTPSTVVVGIAQAA